MTGVIDGNFRAAAIYRNQWSSVSDNPFITIGGSFDANLPFDKWKDIVGAGINVVSDEAGDGSLDLLHISISLAYHKKLDTKGHHFLGIGIQPGFSQRTVSPDNLFFPEQFNGNDFDRSLSNGENFKKNKTTSFDLNTGLVYSGKIAKKITILQGISWFHPLQPNETFLENDDSGKLKNRLTLHGGMRIKLNNTIYLLPNYIYQRQNKAEEINVGSAVEFHIKSKRASTAILGLGAWYRIDDAPIASASLEYNNMRIGLSYDYNTSALDVASNNRGAFEITLIYVGWFVKKDNGHLLVPCPRL